MFNFSAKQSFQMEAELLRPELKKRKNNLKNLIKRKMVQNIFFLNCA